MSEQPRAELAVTFSFEQPEDASAPSSEPTVNDTSTVQAGRSPEPAKTGQTSGNESAEPRPAIRQAARAPRVPTAAAKADVDRLLRAAGLRAVQTEDVTVTTADGIWVSVQGEHPIIIGRSGTHAHLVVDDPSVSRRHCRVARSPGGDVTVEDLASANGTWLHRGEARIDLQPGQPHRVEDGDWIRCGTEIALAYVSIAARGM